MVVVFWEQNTASKNHRPTHACPLHNRIACCFVHFALLLKIQWIRHGVNGWCTEYYQMNAKLVPVYVGIKLLMQIGWSYRVGSIKGDWDSLKLHSALIRQPAATLNKWKCIPFPSFPSICLCALHHPEELNRALILHLIFPNSPLLSLPVSLCLHPSPSFFSRW